MQLQAQVQKDYLHGGGEGMKKTNIAGLQC